MYLILNRITYDYSLEYYIQFIKITLQTFYIVKDHPSLRLFSQISLMSFLCFWTGIIGYYLYFVKGFFLNAV
jgi:hypothetical protein